MTTTTASLSPASDAQPGGTSPARSAEESDRPLIDHAVLDKLRADLDEYEEVWKVFIQNFINALPGRIERLRSAMTTGDLSGAMDAVLSLKSASQMVGADRLAVLAAELELAQRDRTRDADASIVLPRLAVEHLPRIKQRAGQTSYVLGLHLKRAR